MAELTSFSYRPGISLLHKIDARFKLVIIVITGLSSLQTSLSGIAILFMLVVWGLYIVRIRILQVIKEIYILLCFMIVVFGVRAFSADGRALIKVFDMNLTHEGLIEGSLFCLRIILIVLSGLLLTSTTRTAQVKASIDWILRPFTFIPEGRVSTMTGLMMRFIPVIFEQARETASAQKARCIENRKNPFYRTVKFSIPLFTRIFHNSNRISMAMEARCYSGIRTGVKLSSERKDWIILVLVASVCIASVVCL
jgi:energy-coupling factor transporter transmembrane protein EcfT